MNLNRIINQPQKRAAAYLSARTEAWMKFDNDHELAIDEAPDKDQVKISGQDGSTLRGSVRYMGHHGTYVTEFVENNDGSANMFWGTEDMSRGWNVRKNADGSYEGVRFKAVEGTEPVPPERPQSISNIFTDYAPEFIKETSIKASPLDSAEAEEIFKRDEAGINEWDFLPDDLSYEERQEMLWT